ncbi:hypothetical protein BHE74_00056024 [Ensete ventricosum]|nr:hypothetical protein GW17_00042422 [Ensete ventricosum]RWW38724.1 hypothetical protein BHE74_00056024 [Ensete ventricosum]RZR92241.1 hypothetical protein BHM03_00020516 [Ensete ventricosum]
MLSQPSEDSRVHKVAFADSHDTPGPTSGRLLRRGSMRPSCTKALTELLVLGRDPPTIKSGSTRCIRPATCWHGCCRLVGPLRLLCPAVGQLTTGVLPCYRPPVVRYVMGRSGPNAR